MVEVLTILHRHTTGWHTFTSLQLPGLFVTAKDEDSDELLETLPSTINALIRAHSNRMVSAVPLKPYVDKFAEAGCPDEETVIHFMLSDHEV
jgi:hypothetical protein